LENVNVATTSTNASGHASSGDFFNSHNCYYNNYNNNNECFDAGDGGVNCLENSFENYYNHNNHLSSSCEQYQHQNNFSSFNNSLNNNHNNNYNQQQQNYSSNNYLSSSSPYLASTTITPSSSYSSSQNSDWHSWIDDLIKQVQNEVAAEKKVFLELIGNALIKALGVYFSKGQFEWGYIKSGLLLKTGLPWAGFYFLMRFLGWASNRTGL